MFKLYLNTWEKLLMVRGITSITKKEVWEDVARVYNAYCTTGPRSSTDLAKKWEHLIGKHRPNYQGNARHLAASGYFFSYIKSCVAVILQITYYLHSSDQYIKIT